MSTFLSNAFKVKKQLLNSSTVTVLWFNSKFTEFQRKNWTSRKTFHVLQIKRFDFGFVKKNNFVVVVFVHSGKVKLLTLWV